MNLISLIALFGLLLMSTAELNKWKLESLRLTVFLEKEIEVDLDSFWNKATGQYPEKTETRKHTGDRLAEGDYENWRVSLSANSLTSKVDWVVFPKEFDLTGFSTIGNYIEETKKFSEIFGKWVKEECPPSVRVAYGAVMIQDVPDRQSGYKALAENLPCIEFDLENWTDFLFQVNSAIESKVDTGMKINRLSRWNAIQMMRVVDQQESPQIVTNACRLELDLSTSIEHKEPFSSSKLFDHFAELKLIADEFSTKGLKK